MEPVLRRFDARDYLRILTKRKWFIIMVALAAMVIGGLYTVSYPKTYKASAIVIIRRQGQPIIWVGDPQARTAQREDLALDTQARIAASIDCADQAAKALANRTTGDAIQVSGQEIAASINTTPSEPDLLRIEAVHRDSKYAVEFANAVALAFVDKSKQLRQTESTAAKEFLDEAMKRARTSLDEAQAEAATYQEQIGIVVPEDEPRSAVQQLVDYENELQKAEANLSAAQSDVRVVEGQLAHTPAFRTVKHEAPNPERQAKLDQLQQAQMQLVQLRARYTDNWPAVQQTKDQIEELQAQIARLPETITQTSVEPEAEQASLRHEAVGARRQVAEAQARVNNLRATVAQLRAAKQTMPPKLAHLNRLLDRVELAKISFRNVQAQLENARLNEAKEQADAELIDHAAVASEVSPKLGRMLIFSLTLGLAAGIALALFLEALDDTLHSPDDIAAYTEATFLGMVPMLEDPTQGLITVISPKSPPAEAYRTLRSNIHFAQVDHPAHTFVITSAGAGEGKTMTTANLAAVFAQAGQEVLLIDADLRRPSLHRIFNVSSERGLTNVLVGETDLTEVMFETDVPGLHIIPTGPLPPNPAELLESQQMTRVIARAQELADVVFFDSPPAIVLTDAVILSSKVERTILVAEAGQVTRDAFNEMCRLINNARGTILGVVLNKLRLSAADYYYYYYYYDYSHCAPRRGTPTTPMTMDGQPQAGFSSADAPTILEDIFGIEDAAPPAPQVQQPPVSRTPMTLDQPPEIGQPPAITPPEQPDLSPPMPQIQQPPEDELLPPGDQPPDDSNGGEPPSPLQDLFGPDNDNQQ
ncbi:MAG: polysaccharide biosynthesis tyrosine autokinase [Armatimonadetes bacterium]|nr:polysaccharide biosynthesis tyrosine autokinase [Armatimonadota bacterium]